MAKKILIVGIFVMLVVVGLCGCIQVDEEEKLDSVKGQLGCLADPTIQNYSADGPIVFLVAENTSLENINKSVSPSNITIYYLLGENGHFINCTMGDILDPFNTTSLLFDEFSYGDEIIVYGKKGKGIVELIPVYPQDYNTIKIDHIELVRKYIVE